MPCRSRATFPLTAPRTPVNCLLLVTSASHPHRSGRPHHLGFPRSPVHQHSPRVLCSLIGACGARCLRSLIRPRALGCLRRSSSPPRLPTALRLLCIHTACPPHRGPCPEPSSAASRRPSPFLPPRPPDSAPGPAGPHTAARHLGAPPPLRSLARRPAQGSRAIPISPDAGQGTSPPGCTLALTPAPTSQPDFLPAPHPSRPRSPSLQSWPHPKA